MTISNVQSNILWEFMDSPLLLLIFSLIPKRELPAKEKLNYMLSKRIYSACALTTVNSELLPAQYVVWYLAGDTISASASSIRTYYLFLWLYYC